MAVISSNLKSRAGTILINNQTSAAIEFYVETDSKADIVEVYTGALTASPDPVPAVYSVAQGSYVISVDVEQQEPGNFLRWIVTANLGQLPDGTNPGDDDGSGSTVEPKERVATRSVTRHYESEQITKDTTGVLLRNSCGEVFPELPVDDKAIVSYTIEKNYDTLDEIVTLNETYDNTTNSADVNVRGGAAVPKTLPRNTLKYAGTSASSERFEGSVSYWTGTTTVAYRKEGWQANLISMGWKMNKVVAEPVGTIQVDAEDDNGQKALSPVKLDSDGIKIPDDSDAQHVMTFTIYEEADFQPLFDDPPRAP